MRDSWYFLPLAVLIQTERSTKTDLRRWLKDQRLAWRHNLEVLARAIFRHVLADSALQMG